MESTQPVAESRLFWHVVRTHPRQEARAAENLRAGRVEVFCPTIRRRSPGRRRKRPFAAVPMFPQYLFARFCAEERLHDVTFTRGVQTVLRLGESLAIVDDWVVDFLQSRVEADGSIAVGDPLQPGERVLVEDGPFSGWVGIVERLLPERDRIVILFGALKTPIRVDIAAEVVRHLPSSAA